MLITISDATMREKSEEVQGYNSWDSMAQSI